SGEVEVIGSPEDVANQYTESNYESLSSKKVNKTNGTSSRVPYFKVTSSQKRVLSNEENLELDIEYQITDETPVRVFISIIEEKRGATLLANGTEVISKKGENKLKYIFPLKYYNDCDIF